jgi:hypothetical protein
MGAIVRLFIDWTPESHCCLSCAVILSSRTNWRALGKNLRVIPAMAAGISDRLWTLEEFVEQPTS